MAKHVAVSSGNIICRKLTRVEKGIKIFLIETLNVNAFVFTSKIFLIHDPTMQDNL